MKVGIIGAGIGGLTLGLALVQRGMAVEIYERANALGEIGAGITLFPNATRALFSLGLRDALQAIGQEFDHQSLWHYQSGETIKSYERGELMWRTYGAPLYGLHRADLHGILADAFMTAAPGSVFLDHEMTHLDLRRSQSPSVHFANDKAVTADVIVGCDGIKSRVRQVLFGDGAPKFTGITAWRALVPIDRVPLRIRSDPAGIHIGPGCTFSHYPIRGGRVLNYDAFAVVDGWTEEGWTVRSSIDEIKGQFSDFNADILELIKQTPPENLFKWGLFDRDVQTRWSVDSVTLLGDAAHPMLPFLGQGSGIAIEDAVVLARLLSEGGDLVEALARYERARFPRAEFATLTGRKHAQVYSTHPDLRDERDLEVSIDLNDYDASTVPI